MGSISGIEVRRPAGLFLAFSRKKFFLGMVIFFKVLGSESSEHGHTPNQVVFQS